MTWQDGLATVWHWLSAVASKLGLGGGVGILALLLYWRAPRVDAPALVQTFFDALMHLIGNGRSGERRLADGTIIWIVKPRRDQPGRPERDAPPAPEDVKMAQRQPADPEKSLADVTKVLNGN